VVIVKRVSPSSWVLSDVVCQLRVVIVSRGGFQRTQPLSRVSSDGGKGWSAEVVVARPLHLVFRGTEERVVVRQWWGVVIVNGGGGDQQRGG